MKCKLFPLNKEKKYISKLKNIKLSWIIIKVIFLLTKLKNYFKQLKDYIIFQK